MTARPGLRSYIAWSLGQLSLFIFKPSEYVETTGKYTQPKERMRYLLKFLVLPCLIIVLVAAVVAYFCTIYHVRYSITTTVINLAVGMGVGVLLGFPVGMLFGIPFGLLFGMTIGVIVGYPYALYATLPLPTNHLSAPIPAPMRQIWNTCAMASLGGAYFRTITVVLGSATRGVLFGMGLGCVHGIAVGLLLDPWTGLLSGTVIGVALAVGFTQKHNSLGSVIFSAAFGAAFGIPLAEAFRFVKQPGYEPIWGIWVALAATGCFWLTYERYLLYPLRVLQMIACYRSIKDHAWDATSNVLAAWRKCPIFRDETMRAPLPFVTEFLVRIGKENRSEGLKQIFSLMAKKDSQYGVAFDAFVQLIPLDLDIQTIDDIAQVSSKITWMQDIPEGLIPNLADTLLVFDEVSQKLTNYATTDSKYAEHRKALLGAAIRDMLSLQKSLSVRGGLAIVNFLETANHWLEVLNAERLLYSETESQQIPQVFTYGNALRNKSNMFVGRREIIQDIQDWALRDVEDANQDGGPTASFHGPRRMGKSSLLQQLRGALDRRLVPVIIDCQDFRVTNSATTHLNIVMQEIAKALLDQCRVDYPAPVNVEERDGNLFAVFNGWMSQIARILPQDRKKVLLCIDEYEYLAPLMKKDWGKPVFNNYRYLAKERHLYFLYTGAASFARLGGEWADSFINIRDIRLTFLTEGEAVELLRKPCLVSPLVYHEDCIDRILTQTRCQPFLLQAVGFELIHLLNSKQELTATSDHADFAVRLALKSGANYFASCWDYARAEGQQILEAIAKAEPVPDYPEARKRLVEDEFLTEDSQFVVPMYEAWVRGNYYKHP